MRSTLALLFLAATQLAFGPCDKSDDKKDDGKDDKSTTHTKDDEDKGKSKKKKDEKKGDDDDDDDKSGSKKKKKSKDDGDDDDDDKGGSKTLTCFDSVNSLGNKVKGMSFSATCPKGCTSGSVWGSGPYTADSLICVAAVHAGVITAKSGGDVSITIGPGLASYKGSSKNGVTSADWAAFPKSYSFVGPIVSSDDTADATASFAGSYSSNWGTTVFTQKGNAVSGSYPGGTLACSVVKSVSLSCQWFESGDMGRAFLTRNASNGVIAGTWGSGTSSSDGGSWTFIPIKK
jgi:hypothetical protein